MSARFLELVSRWEEETQFLSYIDEKHEAFQEVIAMGEAAIPLLLARIDINPHWSLALARITQVWPALPEHAGMMREVREAWLRWGRANGHIKDDRPHNVQMREAADRVWEIAREYGLETKMALKSASSSLHEAATRLKER